MRKSVKKTPSSDESEELNVQQPERPESSRSRRGRKSEPRGSGEEMVEVRGKTKVEGSSHQPDEGGRKRKSGINTDIDDLRIQLGDQMKKLRRGEEELLEENKRLKSEIIARRQDILGMLMLTENSPMHVDSPVDPMEIDPPEGNGTETSQNEVLESAIIQYLDQLEEMKATNKNLTMENGKLDSMLAALDKRLKMLKNLDETDNKIPHNEELATKKHVTAGKDITEAKRMLGGKLNEAQKEKPLMAIVSSAMVLIDYLLSTVGSAKAREATLDEQASTSALGIKGTKGTTDVPKLVKIIWEACDSYLEEEKASPGAQIESRAVNAEEEDNASQAEETSDDDN
ncbi:hypothetical protein SLEP1_g18606 [Rubroshorea leprosula]|uniref:Uncharacterized protein n=1 Tax=Rubroshorea leprosula TaxID=152421 RepID=A0AAV5J8M4_9ROSI|nr:hypothetical protein SLEP1_g18606 [Rubroshorea leprosula]